MAENNPRPRAADATGSEPGAASLGELALEREKFRENQKLTNRAAGRLTLGVSTFTLALLCALLAGGAGGAWLVALHQQQNRGQVTASLIHALGSGTNALSEAEGASPLLRALGRPGRAGGYLLILD